MTSITTKIQLKVPSGKVIVTDNLSGAYPYWSDDEVYDYNSFEGQAKAVEIMASRGVAYGPVGNSCPGFYRTGPDTYVLANLPYNEDADKETLPEGWTYLTAVITDLWAYSIADHDDWLSKGGDPTGLGWADTIVDLPVGVYEFTHHTGEEGFDRDADTVIFADIRKVG